jgi:hypothetical protein
MSKFNRCLVADSHPEADVIGVDLSPIQPSLFVYLDDYGVTDTEITC